MTYEDVPDCSDVPDAFGSMEFSDAASLFEESPLEEFSLNTHRTKQVSKDLVLVSCRKNTILNPEIYFSLYIMLITYLSIWWTLTKGR